MKSLLVASLLAFSIPFQSAAAEYKCVGYEGQTPFQNKVTLEVQHEIYKVTYAKQTRNSYKAVYELEYETPVRIGYLYDLLKVADFSTWKDMPLKLSLLFDPIRTTWHLYGLGSSGFPIDLACSNDVTPENFGGEL